MNIEKFLQNVQKKLISPYTINNIYNFIIYYSIFFIIPFELFANFKILVIIFVK